MDKAFENQETLVNLKQELEKQGSDLLKIVDSIKVLRDTHATTGSEAVLNIMKKYESLALDKKQIIVNVKVCIMKMEQALKQAKKVEEEVVQHYENLVKARKERAAIKVDKLPVDDIEINIPHEEAKKKKTFAIGATRFEDKTENT